MSWSERDYSKLKDCVVQIAAASARESGCLNHNERTERRTEGRLVSIWCLFQERPIKIGATRGDYIDNGKIRHQWRITRNMLKR